MFVNESRGKLSKRANKGVFVLEEKIKRSKDRVNLQKLSTNDNAEPNITGGYIFKKDHESMMGNVMPTEDGGPNMMGGNSSSRSGYPSGPGGFPADPKGFMPSRGSGRSSRSGARFEDRLRTTAERDNVPPPAGPVVTFDGQPPHAPPEAQRQMQLQIERGVTPANGPRPEGSFFSRLIQSFGRPGMPSVQEIFYTGRAASFDHVEPKPEEIIPAQKAWLVDHLNQFENVLYGPDFKDPTRGYAAYIDVDSFIDQHLLVEVTKNIDGFRFSTFFQKDRGGKIKMEPVWDWNLSFGNANGKQGWLPEYGIGPNWTTSNIHGSAACSKTPTSAKVRRSLGPAPHDGVCGVEHSRAHWRPGCAVGRSDDAEFPALAHLGKRIWPNYYVGRSYEEEVNWMKDWIATRVTWIDRQFVAAPTVARGEGKATLSTPAGTIYYALDGTDPRLPGGGVSPKARVYDGAIALPGNARLVARVQFENRWSPPAKL